MPPAVGPSITSIQTYIKALAHAQRVLPGSAWYRGQSRTIEQWPLLPKALRDDLHAKAESQLLNRFLLGAKARRTPCPAPLDFASWLQLAQHYALPTRLLDWSRSPLIALFFAVQEDHDDSAGEVLVLDPGAMNHSLCGSRSFLNLLTPDIEPMILQAFGHSVESEPFAAAAVTCWESDPRMMVQQSAFTIHSRPSGGVQALSALRESEKWLQRLPIDQAHKRSLRNELDALGVKREYLFPDLENLAESLYAEYRGARPRAAPSP